MLDKVSRHGAIGRLEARRYARFDCVNGCPAVTVTRRLGRGADARGRGYGGHGAGRRSLDGMRE